MSLYEDMMTDCVLRVPTPTPDAEGGSTTAWADGTAFKAAIVKVSDRAERVAERPSDVREYTVTADRVLNFHEVFKRKSDSAIFRITSRSTDSEPPASATFSFKQVTAEDWKETT